MTFDTFIAKWARCALQVQSYFTLYYWGAKPFARPEARSFWFVDVWVLSFFVLSALAFLLSFRCANSTFQSAAIVLVIVRLWELVPYGLKVAIFTEPNKGTTDIRDARRSVIILLLNYAEMILWFATCYSIFFAKGQLQISGNSPALIILRESVMLTVANSTDAFKPLSSRVWFTLLAHNVSGLLMTIVIAARFISFLPQARTVKRGR